MKSPEDIKEVIDTIGYLVEGRGPLFLTSEEITKVSKELGLLTHSYSSLYLAGKEPEMEYNYETEDYEYPKDPFITYAYDPKIISWNNMAIKEGLPEKVSGEDQGDNDAVTNESENLG